MTRSDPTRLATSIAAALAIASILAAPAHAAGYRPAAEAACVQYDHKTNALGPIRSAADLKRQLVTVPKLFHAMVVGIAALHPPTSQTAQARQLVGSLRQVEQAMGRIRDAFLQGDQAGVSAAVRSGSAPSRAAAKAARALGLPTCARLAASATSNGPS